MSVQRLSRVAVSTSGSNLGRIGCPGGDASKALVARAVVPTSSPASSLAARRHRTGVVLALAAGTVLGIGRSAMAADYTYTGGGAGTAAQPVSGTVSTGITPAGTPVDGDSLLFNSSGTTAYTANYDLTTLLRSLRFTNAGPVNVTGGSIGFDGANSYIQIAPNGTTVSKVTVGSNLSLASGSLYIVKATGGSAANTPLFNGSTFTLGSGTNAYVALADTGGDDNAEMTIANTLSGSGTLTLNNNQATPSGPAAPSTTAFGTLLLTGNNSGFSGAVNITKGRVVVNNNDGLGTGLVTITGGAEGGTLALGGNNAGTANLGQTYGGITGPGITLANNFNLAGATSGSYAYGLANNSGNNTLSGAISLTSAAVNVTVTNASTLTMSGAVTETTASTITKTGNGGLIFTNAGNSFTGGVTATNGYVRFASGALPATGTITLTNAALAVGPSTAFATVNAALTSGRLAAASVGALALTADSSEAVDFANGGNATLGLGAIGNVEFTGTINPFSAAAGYRLMVQAGSQLKLTGTNQLTGANPLVVGGTNFATNYVQSSTVILNGTNDFTGGVTLAGPGAKLQPAVPGALGTTGTITFSGGILQAPATGTIEDLSSRFSTANGQAYKFDTNGRDVIFGTLFNSGATSSLEKLGTGSLELATGTTALQAGSILIRGGSINVPAGKSLTTTSFTSIGVDNNDVGTLNVTGGTYSSAGDFNVGDVANSRGTVNLSAGVVRGNTLYVGKNGTTTGVITTSSGVVNQTGGSFYANTASSGEWRIGGGATTAINAVGVYNLSGGALSTYTTAPDLVNDPAGTGQTGAAFQVGGYGVGQMNLTGGRLITGSWTDAGRYPGSYGVIDVSGTGRFIQNSTANRLFIGEQGYGIVNVRGGEVITRSGTSIGIAGTSAGGVLNLNGGTYTTAYIDNSGVNALGSVLNFNGGVLRGTTAVPNFIRTTAGANAIIANVFSGGALIDTTNGDLGIGQALVAPAGNGITSIAATGSGFVTKPIVKITGGGGTGATALADIDGSGNITGITIVNPGTGYTSAPTVQIYGANGGTATVGTVSLGSNAANGGGLTKLGLQVLTLSGANTYTGNTLVSNGALAVTTPASLPGYNAGKVSVASGAALTVYPGASNFTQANVDAIVGAGGVTFDPNAAFGFDTTAGNYTYANDFNYNFGLAKTGANTLTLTGQTNYTGPTLIYNGQLDVSSPAILGTGSGATTVYNGGSIVLANGVNVSGEAITINGTNGTAGGAIATALNATASVNGAITLGSAGVTNATAARLSANGATASLTVSGTISGGSIQNLDISGLGTGTGGVIRLQNAVGTYAGITSMIRGNVVMDNYSMPNPTGAVNAGSSGSTENPFSLTVLPGTNLADVNGFTVASGAGAYSSTFTMTGGTINSRGGVFFGTAGAASGSSTTASITGGTINATAGEFWLSNTANNPATLTLGGTGAITVNNWVAIGRNGGTGTLNITGGSLTKGGPNGSFIAGSLGGRGTVNQSGGTVSIPDSASVLALGENSNTGTYNLSGTGTVSAPGGLQLSFRGAAVGTFNLSGGTVDVGSIRRGFGVTGTAAPFTYAPSTGAATFNFDGGLLRPTASNANFMPDVQNVDTGVVANTYYPITTATVSAGGARINTNGFDIGIAKALVANAASPGGGLTKGGPGTLTLTGANTYTGTTAVTGGTLAVNTAAATPLLAGTGTTGGTDIQNGTVSFAGGDASVIRGLLASSFTDAVTPGVMDTGTLRSSLATAARGLGYRDDGVGNVIVKAALFGDADLDGGVSINDFNTLAGNFGASTGKVWVDGDFDYDGGVSINDFNLLAGGFGQTLPPTSEAWAGLIAFAAAHNDLVAFEAFTGVPEPTSLGLIAATGVMGMRRKRRVR